MVQHDWITTGKQLNMCAVHFLHDHRAIKYPVDLSDVHAL